MHRDPSREIEIVIRHALLNCDIVKVYLPDLLRHLDAIHLRHVDVCENESVRFGAPKFVQLFEPFLNQS